MRKITESDLKDVQEASEELLNIPGLPFTESQKNLFRKKLSEFMEDPQKYMSTHNFESFDKASPEEARDNIIRNLKRLEQLNSLKKK